MCICRVGQNRIYTPYITVYFGDFPTKNTVFAPYIYGSGQPYVYGLGKLRQGDRNTFPVTCCVCGALPCCQTDIWKCIRLLDQYQCLEH